MSVTKEEVRKVARLAHLEYPRIQDKSGQWVDPPELLIDDEVLGALAQDMNQILGYMDQLREVDVDGVEPTSHGVPLPTRYRDDAPGEGLETEAALQGSPARVGEAFSVPKIIE